MYHRNELLLSLFLLVATNCIAQVPHQPARITIAADTQLQKRSGSWQRSWGTNRRAEWATPVTVPVLMLDTAYGGLTPYERGGGNESRTLHLKTAGGKEYTLRSVTKSRDDVVPPDFDNTFVETIIKDGISSSYPYASFALPVMQAKAGLLYTVPKLVYLPQQPLLDSFNTRFGNALYLIEQRPDGNWEEAANLGNHEDFTSSDKLINKLQEDIRYRTRQYAFIKARLFDMLIGDWDRHEGNWRWGKKEDGPNRSYTPIARDRDQAFYTHNGKLLDKMLPLGGFSYMQHFDHQMGDPVSLNTAAWDFDRFFSNEMTLQDWLKAANDLRSSLTNDVIAASVKQLPPEIYSISGQELIDKLILRREQLPAIAATYYHFIAKQVEIVGSEKKERFEVKATSDSTVLVEVSRIDKNGVTAASPAYRREFKASETDEIRIFGIAGDDVYTIDLQPAPLVVRIIGGLGKDSVIHNGERIHIYDNRDNVFQTGAVRWHLSSDSAIHRYEYENYRRSSKGFSPAIGFNNPDRIYVGLKYSYTTHRWRRDPFATKQTFRVHYAIQQTAISAGYSALYPNLFGNWDLFIDGGFDAIRWTNYFGTGNETTSPTKTNGYHRTLSREWLGDAGLRLDAGKNHFEFACFYQRLKIKRDTGSYVARYFMSAYEDQLLPNNYGGIWLSYQFESVNDEIVPTKGFTGFAKGSYARNFDQDEFFQHYTVKLQSYLPLGNKFSIAVVAGGSTMVGSDKLLNSARVYEHAVVGGARTLRGYRMERFWGKTAFYNNNELRFITKLRSYLLNARAGLIAFFDDGRVWMPGENSNTIHTSYGGGILLAPYNQFCVMLTYGISPETRMVQLRVNKLF